MIKNPNNHDKLETRIEIPSWPQYGEPERQILEEVLNSGVWWKTPGEQVYAFEEEFAQYLGVNHVIGVTNGTAALEIAMSALEIGPGDEVIVPDYTFIATASAVLFAGAMPVFVDINPDTYCIDPDEIEKAITPRTKAVIVVHVGGHPVDLDRIQEICTKHQLYLVEDSSHAHGSEWNGKKVGGFGHIGTFSFQQSKLLTAGEGGVVVTNDPELAKKARSVHDCGRMPEKWFYGHFIYGSNYRMSEWQGAILRKQLERLPGQTKIRTRNALLLNEKLPLIPGIVPQTRDSRCTCNGHYAYIFRYDQAAFQGLSREDFIKRLETKGVPVQSTYPPLHQLAVFQSGEYQKRLSPEVSQAYTTMVNLSRPHTEKAALETVWIPQPVLLAEEGMIESILSVIRTIYIEENKK